MSPPALSPCAALVRRGDPDRFLSAMTAPPALRERLFALYAFNLELARIPAVVSEPTLGAIRLQWWRDAVALAYEGRPRSHEVAAPLADAIVAADLPRAPFERLMDARALDMEPGALDGDAALRTYLRDTGAALLALSSHALAGETGPAEAAGFGFAAAAWLRAQPALVAGGRRAMTLEAAQSLARDGLAALAEARRAGAPRGAEPAYRAGWLAEAALRAALAPGFDPEAGPAAPSPFRARASLLWRAALGSW